MLGIYCGLLSLRNIVTGIAYRRPNTHRKNRRNLPGRGLGRLCFLIASFNSLSAYSLFHSSRPLSHDLGKLCLGSPSGNLFGGVGKGGLGSIGKNIPTPAGDKQSIVSNMVLFISSVAFLSCSTSSPLRPLVSICFRLFQASSVWSRQPRA